VITPPKLHHAVGHDLLGAGMEAWAFGMLVVGGPSALVDEGTSEAPGAVWAAAGAAITLGSAAFDLGGALAQGSQTRNFSEARKSGMMLSFSVLVAGFGWLTANPIATLLSGAAADNILTAFSGPPANAHCAGG